MLRTTDHTRVAASEATYVGLLVQRTGKGQAAAVALRDEDWSATSRIAIAPPRLQTVCPHTRTPKSACVPIATVTLSTDTFWNFGDLKLRTSLPLGCFQQVTRHQPERITGTWAPDAVIEGPN